MSFEQMKEVAKTIELLEKDLMRDLTEEEVEMVINKGWKYFLFNHLNMSEEEFVTFKKVRELLSNYFTGTDKSYEEALSKCNENVYFLLRNLASDLEEAETPIKKLSEPENKVVKKSNIHKDFENFLKNLHKCLKPVDLVWFDKLTDNINNKLFEVYKKNTELSEDELGGLITDKAKDEIILDLVAQLKDHKTVEMTNDEFMEVADYLTEHENHVYLCNNNGKVTLK